MVYRSFYILAADNYSCDTYGEHAYSECGTSSTTAPGESENGSSGGFLADTGYNVLIPVALGVAIIIASLILLTKRIIRSRKQHV